MLSRAATRTTTSLVARRGFHSTRARLSSPYHYPEGAYSNIPFNPRSKWFGVGFWTFMGAGFFAPFGISGAWFPSSRAAPRLEAKTDVLCSLADLQAHLNSRFAVWAWRLSIGRSRSSVGGLLCTYPNRHHSVTFDPCPQSHLLMNVSP
ncbi:hypothetical protein BGZ61DRAFT_349571 [Ilyonectria robusta]|uniref:uncharacterized protein n=1 Tax=Ilyonectria robusta TaxID=1079257 RepID=UPI001E8EDFBB|nr:uncharacterized protein BGZ61DRAFT_349571 [Ilyonectria robusta]KAH8714475.1 hypothetical protein BGZ61DRAFT_349571 [Ilyonectria robusta]